MAFCDFLVFVGLGPKGNNLRNVLNDLVSLDVDPEGVGAGDAMNEGVLIEKDGRDAVGIRVGDCPIEAMMVRRSG